MWTLPRPHAAAAARKLSAAGLVCSAKARYTLRLFPRRVCFAFAKETRCARRGILSAAGQARHCRKCGGGSAVFFQILPIIGRKVYIVPAVPASEAERRNAYRQALGAAIERKYALHNVPRSAPPACAKTAAMSDCFFIIAKWQRQIKEKKLRKLFRKKATDKPAPIKGQGLSVAETYSKEKFRAVTLFFAPRGKISCRLRDPLKTSFSGARRP